MIEHQTKVHMERFLWPIIHIWTLEPRPVKKVPMSLYIVFAAV